MSNGFSDSSGFISSGPWSPGQSNSSFPDPFMDMASLAMPQTIQLALRWMEFITFSNGTYFRALDRIASYFITDIELSDIDDDEEKQKISDYLKNPDGVDIIDDLHTVAINYLVYGNVFSSVLMPFKRNLICKGCSLEMPLKQMYLRPADFNFKWEDFEFVATCKKCGYSGAWQHVDRRLGESGKVKIRHWSPHEIDLLWDPYTDNVDVIWKIPEEYRQLIRKGHLAHLETVPWEVVQCVKHNTHLKFQPENIHHMREATLCGVRNRGWGLPRGLSNFRQVWYVQVLHRYNEAIALDYVIPFRLITPAPGPGSSDIAKDALMNLNMGGVSAQIQQMLKERRRDPASWFTLPFPVQYQAIGGDATQLAPRDLLDQGLEVLLNNIGVPVELYKGSLQIQSAPAALRLFESSWSHLGHSLNSYMAFLMRRLGQLLNWEKASARLQKVTHADDLQRQMAKLQLAIGGQISKQTGYGSVGADFFEETKKKLEEQKYEAEQQQRTQEEMQQSATMTQMVLPPQPGGAPMPGGGPGGAPPPPGGDPASQQVASQQQTIPTKPTTPQEMLQKAQTIAQQLLTLPESAKDSELIQLKKTDPTMHSLVRSQIDEMRRQAQTQGGAMLMDQFRQQGQQGQQ